MPRKKSPEQLYIDGTAPPRNTDVEERIDAWNRAKADAKDAAEAVRLRHASMVQLMADQGLEVYDYTDASTGKRKRVKIKREPKAAVGAAPREKRGSQQEESNDAPATVQAGGEVVPLRAPLPDHSDPFGKIRRELEA